MHYDFKLTEHEEHGYTGLQALFMDGAEPAAGFTCAHDIMEHFSGLDLDSDSEALALGAMLYVRGMAGYFQRGLYPKSPGYAMSGDVARLFTDAWQWGEITDPGRTCRLDDEEAEAWIEEAIRLAEREIRDDYEQRPHSQWGSWVRGWLRKGFRKARKRYSLDPATLCHTFDRMSEALDNAAKNMDEWDIVRVSFVRKTCELSVRVIPIYDPEHPDYEPDQWEADQW